MSRKCIICKKELSDDNKGFLCQYHKDLAKEKVKEGGQKAAAFGSMAIAVGKVAYDHRDEVAAAVKNGVAAVKDIIKNTI